MKTECMFNGPSQPDSRTVPTELLLSRPGISCQFRMTIPLKSSTTIPLKNSLHMCLIPHSHYPHNVLQQSQQWLCAGNFRQGPKKDASRIFPHESALEMQLTEPRLEGLPKVEGVYGAHAAWNVNSVHPRNGWHGKPHM